MRFVIVVVIASVFGGIIGGLIARSHLNSKLISMTRERNQLAEKNKRITENMDLADLQLRYAEEERDSLRAQVAAIQRGAALPATSATDPGNVDTASNNQSSAALNSTGNKEEIGKRKIAISGENVISSQNTQNNTNETAEELEELERKRVDSYLAQQIEVTSDPREQKRLTDLYNQLGNVRELLNKQLAQASTEEEKNQVRLNVAQTRAHMRDLIQEQRNTLYRKELESAGVTSQEQQEQLIRKMEDLHNQNRFFTDHMLLWGMGSAPNE